VGHGVALFQGPTLSSCNELRDDNASSTCVNSPGISKEPMKVNKLLSNLCLRRRTTERRSTEITRTRSSNATATASLAAPSDPNKIRNGLTQDDTGNRNLKSEVEGVSQELSVSTARRSNTRATAGLHPGAATAQTASKESLTPVSPTPKALIRVATTVNGIPIHVLQLVLAHLPDV
jgi:hypothetical protein